MRRNDITVKQVSYALIFAGLFLYLLHEPAKAELEPGPMCLHLRDLSTDMPIETDCTFDSADECQVIAAQMTASFAGRKYAYCCHRDNRRCEWIPDDHQS